MQSKNGHNHRALLTIIIKKIDSVSILLGFLFYCISVVCLKKAE